MHTLATVPIYTNTCWIGIYLKCRQYNQCEGIWVDLIQSLAATMQLALRTLLSVCLSGWLSHFFSQCPSHHIIMKFSWIMTSDKSDVRARGQGQVSKVKVTEVKTLISLFRNVTPVGIHIWQWNDVQSLKWHRIGALLFFKIICQISRSHGTKNGRFSPELGVSGL